MSIAKLKRQRAELSDKLKSMIQNEKSGGYGDITVWKPTLNKQTNTGYAKFRFMPAPEGEELPIVKLFDHSFQGANGKYYINYSRTTLGEPDPVYELNGRLYGTKLKEDEDWVRANTRRNTNFYCNVYVIEDPENKEAEGKVHLYRFGPTIYKMIEDKLQPKFVTDKAGDPFDLWSGCNFVLKAYYDTTKKFWQYEKSAFEGESELFANDDEKKEVIYKDCKSLKELILPEKFKSYDELKKQLVSVLGEFVSSGVPVATDSVDSSREARAQPSARAAAVTPPRVEKPLVETPRPAPVAQTSNSEMDFFESLAANSR